MRDGGAGGGRGRMLGRAPGGVALALAAASAAAAAAAPAAAQDEMTPSAALVGGVFQYDLSGAGAVPFGGVRLFLPLHAWIAVEPAITYAAYESDADDEIPLLVPEVQLQGRLESGRVDPFLGIGIGGAFDLRKNRGGKELVVSSYSAGAGARVRLGRGWSGRAELRLRAVDAFAGSVAEWTLGIARAF